MKSYQPLVLTGQEPFSGPPQSARPPVGEGIMAYSLNDPFLLDFLRDGYEAASGARVSTQTALRNPAMFRAVSLISYAIGMLPLHVIDNETKGWMSPNEVRRLNDMPDDIDPASNTISKGSSQAQQQNDGGADDPPRDPATR